MNLIVWLCGALLAAAHLFGGKLRFLDRTPRSRWLSFGAGVSVSYIFVHLLPEVVEHKKHVNQSFGTLLEYIEYPLFLCSTIGFVVYYGLERFVDTRQEEGDESPTATFWVHTGSFAAYNFVVGYILSERETSSLRELAFYTFAMGLHFVVNDYGLRERHERIYHRVGRYVLAAAILAGFLLGHWATIEPQWLGLAIAALGGATILNVMKEELPEARQSRFGAFAFGAVGYAAVLNFL